MANPLRGEVAIKVGDETFTLVYSVNALCELEEATGATAVEFMAELNAEQEAGKTRISRVRTLVWAGLRERHPDITEKEAGAVMHAAGLDAVMAAVTRAVSEAFPSGEAKAEATAKGKRAA